MDEDNNQRTYQETESAASNGSDKQMKGPLLYIALAVAFLALIGLAFLLLTRQTGDEITTEAPIVEEVPQPESSVVASSIVVADEVLIASATLTAGGFISVHEDADGTIGDSIGVSNFLLPGNYSDISISLTREAVEGEALYIMLIADDGDGVFGYPATDNFAFDQSGIPIGSVIIVSLSEPVEEEEEVVEKEEVIEEEVEEKAEEVVE